MSLALSTGVAAEALEGLTIDVERMPPSCTVKSMEKDYVEVHYTTRIDKNSKAGKPGQKIDTSRDADGLNDPLSFQLGSGRVIKGWDYGVRDMCEGEKRVLTIEPELAYGEEGSEQKNSDEEDVSVPGGATLSIEAEMIKVIRLQKESLFKPETCDKVAEPGDTLKVHYTLWIHPTSISGEGGKQVESSHDDASGPLEFVIGAGRVIPAWDEGLLGHCVGEKLELVVPPEFGYREKGQGEKIPPLATLHFEIELVDAISTDMFAQMDTNSDGKINMDELAVFMKSTQGLNDEKIVKQIFEGEDKNQDGFIDWDEAPFPKGKKKPSPFPAINKKKSEEL